MIASSTLIGGDRGFTTNCLDPAGVAGKYKQTRLLFKATSPWSHGRGRFHGDEFEGLH